MKKQNKPKISSNFFYPWGKKELRKKNIQLEILRMTINSNQIAIRQLAKDLVETIKVLNKTLLIVAHIQTQITPKTKKQTKR